MSTFHKKTKYNHAGDQTDEILTIQKTVRTYISNANYKTANKFLIKESKNHPSSYYIASMLATLNAEDAFVLPENQKKKAFNTTAKKLRILLYSSRGASEQLKNRNINEYYWFSGQPKKQFLFGMKIVANGNINGLYPQGVGAVNYAYKLFSEGKKTIGLRWALKSQLILEEYFAKCRKDYHDPWYWYALSLGLQGKEKEMNIALKKSAKLAKKNLDTDPSFKKFRNMVRMTGICACGKKQSILKQ